MWTHSYTNTRVEDPAELVGKQIFQEKWYRGYVVKYNDVDKTHEVLYIDEDEVWNFNLMEDLLNNDLIILKKINLTVYYAISSSQITSNYFVFVFVIMHIATYKSSL